MLEEFLLDDVKHDICDEKPFYMNCNIPQFPEMKCRATYECGFEDALSLGRRFVDFWEPSTVSVKTSDQDTSNYNPAISCFFFLHCCRSTEEDWKKFSIPGVFLLQMYNCSKFTSSNSHLCDYRVFPTIWSFSWETVVTYLGLGSNSALSFINHALRYDWKSIGLM